MSDKYTRRNKYKKTKYRQTNQKAKPLRRGSGRSYVDLAAADLLFGRSGD